MSFLLDPPLLVLSGGFIVWLSVRHLLKRMRSPTKDRIILYLALLALFLFWGVSIGLFLDLPWTRFLWQPLGARSGTDWQINSGLFHFPASWPIADRTVMAFSILAFAAYPLWLWLGLQAGYILFGANERQTGVVGLLWFKPHPHAPPPPPGFGEGKSK